MVADPRRPGHSLPELIVAVVFLATTVAAVGSMAVVGARRTAEAVVRQTAVRVAEEVLDSLVAAPTVDPGGTTRGPHTVRWGPDGPAGVRVTVAPLAGGMGAPVTLRGAVMPSVPVLPDEAPDSVGRFVAGSPP